MKLEIEKERLKVFLDGELSALYVWMLCNPRDKNR